jgi:hypothetical protein
MDLPTSCLVQQSRLRCDHEVNLPQLMKKDIVLDPQWKKSFDEYGY